MYDALAEVMAEISRLQGAGPKSASKGRKTAKTAAKRPKKR
jgi:hypothetical protein